MEGQHIAHTQISAGGPYRVVDRLPEDTSFKMFHSIH